MVHKVVKGDTLLKIAVKYKTTPQEIVKLNPIIKDPGHIEIGWELKLPAPKPAPPSKVIEYTVLAGDNLTRISKKYNTTIEEIVSMNPSITNPNLVRTGTVIKVPDRRKK
jgi:LysM repeat protein